MIIFFQDLGLTKGDVCSLLLPNCPELAVAVGAAALAGGVSSSFNAGTTPGEIAR